MALYINVCEHGFNLLLSNLLKKQNFFKQNVIRSVSNLNRASADSEGSHREDEEQFRVLDLKKVTARKGAQRREVRRMEVPPPRTTQMKEDQDWPSVWPGPRTFHPATVPLPIRQGRNKLGAPPNKYGNAELMKIPNFLHLTPPAIKRHCEALKQFCTPWPKGLESDAKCEEHFPIEVITSDYCHSSPTIRDPLARIVSITFRLSILKLDAHARDKFLRLVGDRYNSETDIVTIVADRCPLRQQNYDYAMYILTALYHESWMVENWESEKSLDDMEYYDWDTNASKENVLSWIKGADTNVDLTNLPEDWSQKCQQYKSRIQDLFNKGDTDENLRQYKEASLNLVMSNT